jgi:PAS domain S-box-containing protein
MSSRWEALLERFGRLRVNASASDEAESAAGVNLADGVGTRVLGHEPARDTADEVGGTTLDSRSSHRAFVLLRYMLIVGTAYLALAEGGFDVPPPYVVLLIAVALATNVYLAECPAEIVTSSRISGAVIVGDTVWITVVLLHKPDLGSGLLFLYFFVLLLAAIGESLPLVVVGTLVVCVAYLVAHSVSAGPLGWKARDLMAVPFLLTVASFYGYLTDRTRRVRRVAAARAYTVARLERIQEALLREIGERKRATEELRASEEKYRELVEDMRDVIYAVDAEGRITYVSPVVQSLLEMAPDELIGRRFSEFVPPEDLDRVNQVFTQNLGSEAQLFTGEHRVLTRAMALRWVQSCGRLIVKDGRVVGLRGMMTDVTEQRRLEREILNISEDEQRRIGQDLHDGLGQDLAGIGFTTRALERKLQLKSVEEWREARRIAELVNDAIDKTRALARGLHPVEVAEDGLCVALEGLARATSGMFHIACEFDSQGASVAVPQEVATNLYRIAQEAVHNAVRHGQAERVRIELTNRGDRLILEVTDDGCGFSGEAPAGGGIGVRIMHYRARMIGAQLRICRRNAGGTSLECSLVWRGG